MYLAHSLLWQWRARTSWILIDLLFKHFKQLNEIWARTAVVMYASSKRQYQRSEGMGGRGRKREREKRERQREGEGDRYFLNLVRSKKANKKEESWVSKEKRARDEFAEKQFVKNRYNEQSMIYFWMWWCKILIEMSR